MKIAPLIRAIEKANEAEERFSYRLVHTGQHFDAEMSATFFDELGLPRPDVNLGVGSGSHAKQTAAIMIGFERELVQNPADLVIVVGDVNSTLACAIVAKKLHTPLAHIEAGVRSGDLNMPEEINRIVTDSITDYYFTTSEAAGKQLEREGASSDRIFFVGNIMIDSLNQLCPRFSPPALWHDLELQKGRYLVMTLHRPTNVDDPKVLGALLHNISSAAGEFRVVFPAHPRTAKNLLLIDVPRNIEMVPPQSYLQFNYLVEHSAGVITDSGGITTETTVLNIPCLTLRNTTEWPETISMGTNELVGNDPQIIAESIQTMISGHWKKARIPDKWDGKTAERIVETIGKLKVKN